KAARDAGAEQVAPDTLREAQVLLESAEANLRRGAYKHARRDAVAARGKASEALDAARASGQDHVRRSPSFPRCFACPRSLLDALSFPVVCKAFSIAARHVR